MVSGELLSSGTTFRKYIDSKFIKRGQSLLSIDEIEKIPLLNILFVSCCDDCFGDKPIKVAFVPLTKNDIEVDSVIAYDSELSEHTISNTDCPDFPLIVVGVNERVDPIIKAIKYTGLSKQTMISGYNEGYCLSFNEAWLYDDKEPCTKGAAEIYFKVYAYDENGNLIDSDFPEYEDMNHDTIDDDRIERYWSLSENNEGKIIIPWPSMSSYNWYYGGGNSRDCDLKIKACYYYPY